MNAQELLDTTDPLPDDATAALTLGLDIVDLPEPAPPAPVVDEVEDVTSVLEQFTKNTRWAGLVAFLASIIFLVGYALHGSVFLLWLGASFLGFSIGKLAIDAINYCTLLHANQLPETEPLRRPA